MKVSGLNAGESGRQECLNVTGKLQVSNSVNNAESSRKSEQRREKKSGNVVFAGSLNLPSDRIAWKKEQAREQAMQIVKDAFEREQKLDASAQEMRDKINALEAENAVAKQEIADNDKSVQELALTYGIDSDSQEQKDLELLHKRSEIRMGVRNESLTKEESERLAEIDAEGMTEYQARAMELYERNDYLKRGIIDREAQMKANNAAITQMGIERLKTHPILDATKQAESIMKAASEDITSMLVEEAQNHMDEVQEEKKEKAEEKAEKEDAEQEKIEIVRERRELMEQMVQRIQAATQETDFSETKDRRLEEMVSDVLESYVQVQKADGGATDVQPSQDKVNAAVQEILDKLKLLEEDIKGAKVDELM